MCEYCSCAMFCLSPSIVACLCLCVDGQLHLFNSLFMMLDIFVGALPFEWKHMAFAYVYGISCENEETSNAAVDSEYQFSLEGENFVVVVCPDLRCGVSFVFRSSMLLSPLCFQVSWNISSCFVKDSTAVSVLFRVFPVACCSCYNPLASVFSIFLFILL